MPSGSALERLREKAKGYADELRGLDVELSRERYLHSLSALYQQIRAALTPLTEDADARVSIESADLELDEFGERYAAPMLVIRFGRNKVSIQPRGRPLNGAVGRADLLGPVGIHRLVCLGDALDWYVVPSDPDALLPLTAARISELIDASLPA